MNPPSKRNRETSSPSSSQKRTKLSDYQNENNTPENNRKYYVKTHAPGGYCGNEYEIKLSGLIWLNLKYDDDVKDFLLATNVAAVRPLDDICFKITWKDEKRKPIMVFIQLKHRINGRNSSIEFYEMFTAYKIIKKKMREDEDDGLFEDKFDNFECYPILYTNNDFTLKTDPVTDTNYWPKLNDIFGTRGLVRKLSEKGNEGNIKNLRETVKDWNENEFNAFVDNLLVFTRQAGEMGVEEIITEHIDKHHRNFKNPFPIESHPVTLTFIRMFVNWWKEMKKPFCFTKKDDLLENAFKAIIISPRMSSLNVIYKSKINDSYEFTDDAVSSLNLQDQHSSTVITTENSALTVVKVLQHLDNRDHVVLDLEYIASRKMNPGNRKALCEELKTKDDCVVILVCDKIPENETFKDIGEVVRNLRRILISNSNESIEKLKDFFLACEGEKHKEVYDEKSRLTDIREESQLNILKTAKVIFQDKEVNLADIVDDESKKYVKGDVLHEIVCGNTIAVGKLIVKSNNYESKHFWVDRRVNCSNRKVTLKTLNDIEDSVVLVTAGPGMGKSTLLTQLSIKTKEVNPEVWIVRINLLKYWTKLWKWKEEKTAINLRDTLEFMCQVMVREKLGKGNTVEITLEEKDNGVYLKKCKADPLTEFELNLFLHFYREREIIFLIDGFDEIVLYKNVVIKSLKTVSNDPRKHRMWITSRPYIQIKSILEKEFELLSYEIEGLSDKEMEEYLQKFWEFNLSVAKFNSEQRNNIRKLCYHALDLVLSPVVNLDDETLHKVIRSAALYASYKMKDMPLHRHVPHRMCDKQLCYSWYCRYCSAFCVYCENGAVDTSTSSRYTPSTNPLIMYLAAVDIVHNIKYEFKMPSRKNSNDIRDVYDSFLQSILGRQYREEDKMETSFSAKNHINAKMVKESILMFKKLALYSVFSFKDYSAILYNGEDLKEIKQMIDVVEKGEEISDLIVSVEDGMPIFIHKTLAEYLAVEYICDCLKDEENCKKIKYLEIMFLNGDHFQNLIKLFENKLSSDQTLYSSLENNKDDVVLKIILNLCEKNNCMDLTFCLNSGTSNVIWELFEKIIKCGLSKTDLHDSERKTLSQALLTLKSNVYGETDDDNKLEPELVELVDNHRKLDKLLNSSAFDLEQHVDE